MLKRITNNFLFCVAIKVEGNIRHTQMGYTERHFKGTIYKYVNSYIRCSYIYCSSTWKNGLQNRMEVEREKEKGERGERRRKRRRRRRRRNGKWGEIEKRTRGGGRTGEEGAEGVEEEWRRGGEGRGGGREREGKRGDCCAGAMAFAKGCSPSAVTPRGWSWGKGIHWWPQSYSSLLSPAVTLDWLNTTGSWKAKEPMDTGQTGHPPGAHSRVTKGRRRI